MTSHEDFSATQSALLEAIYGDSRRSDFKPEGLAVYRRSLCANATRALRISFPTVKQLVGEDSFVLLSRRFLKQHPFTGGDWGAWGHTFSGWIAQQLELKAYPYLGDCAQLDWECHIAERATDDQTDLESLGLLAHLSPYQLKFRFCAGSALVNSDYPIVAIWRAHQSERLLDNSTKVLFDKFGESGVQNNAETALVCRPVWQAQVKAITELEYAWLRQTLHGGSIGAALDRMQGSSFSLEQWLPEAIANRLVCGIDQLTTHSS